MKAFILCGGFGTRMKPFKADIPKPLIKVNNKEIILRIIEEFKKNGINKFYLLCGYKIDEFIKFKKKHKNIDINIINSGLYSLTAKRIYHVKKYLLENEKFILTYGDSLIDFDYKESFQKFKNMKTLLHIQVHKLKEEYGNVKIKGSKITEFIEKRDKYINAGFYICDYNMLKFITSDNISFESKILPLMAKKKLISFSFTEFWHPIDNENNYRSITKILKK